MAELHRVTIDGVEYNLPSGGGGGSSVIPNPEGTPTAKLEKLQIEDTIFNIESGMTDVDWRDISGKPEFANVATSGSYNDLSHKPTSLPASDVKDWAKADEKPTYTASEVGALPSDTHIPDDVTESTISGWGFTKNTGTYTKPNDGIPKTDLSSDVQTSLGKADTALQSFIEEDPTVPSHVKSITSDNIDDWNNKLDSKNPFIETTSLKTGGELRFERYSDNLGATSKIIDVVFEHGEPTERTVLEFGYQGIKLNNHTLNADVPSNAKFTDTVLTETDISNMGFTKNAGTITEVKMNGNSMGSSGVIDLGSVITSLPDISHKVDDTRKVNGKALSSDVTLSANDILTNDNMSIQKRLDELESFESITYRGTVASFDELPTNAANGDMYYCTADKLHYVCVNDPLIDFYEWHEYHTFDDDYIITVEKVANNLTTVSEGYVLDARQGKELKDAIDNLPSMDNVVLHDDPIGQPTPPTPRDCDTLGGKTPEYYAKQSDVSELNQNLTDILQSQPTVVWEDERYSLSYRKIGNMILANAYGIISKNATSILNLLPTPAEYVSAEGHLLKPSNQGLFMGYIIYSSTGWENFYMTSGNSASKTTDAEFRFYGQIRYFI